MLLHTHVLVVYYVVVKVYDIYKNKLLIRKLNYLIKIIKLMSYHLKSVLSRILYSYKVFFYLVFQTIIIYYNDNRNNNIKYC